MLLFIEGRWYCYKRCYKHPKTRNLCWSHSSFANSMRWVRLSEKFLFLPPLCSLLTQNREHIPLSQGHHDEGGKGGGGGQREGEENTWRTEHGSRSPPTTHFSPPSLPPFRPCFFLCSVSFPSFLYSPSCWLSLFLLAFFSTFVSYSLSHFFFISS